MPRADFRSKNDSLDPQALVKLLAVMCFPANARGREEMMRGLPSAMTIPRYQSGSPAAADGIAHDDWAGFLRHQSRANLAGSLCLAMAQLSASGHTGDAATVLNLAAELAGKWEHAVILSSPLQPVPSMSQRAETEILSAFDQYRSVPHLWAAAVYGRIQFGEEFVPAALHSIPRFLAFADEIARLATSLAWLEPRPPLLLLADSLWTFILPTALIRKAAADVNRVTEESGAKSYVSLSGKDANV